MSTNLIPQLDFCTRHHGVIWEKQSPSFLLAKHFTGLSNFSPLQDLVAFHVVMHRTLLPDGQSCHELFLFCTLEFYTGCSYSLPMKMYCIYQSNFSTLCPLPATNECRESRLKSEGLQLEVHMCGAVGDWGQHRIEGDCCHWEMSIKK